MLFIFVDGLEVFILLDIVVLVKRVVLFLDINFIL